MKQLKLKVSSRSATGTSAVKKLRAHGQVPGVIYGKIGAKNLIVEEKDLRMLMRQASGTATLVLITDETGKETLSLIKKLDRHSFKDTFVHVDFYEVDRNKEMHAKIPVHTHGTSFGEQNQGGTIDVHMHMLDIKCLPKDLPEEISVDISDLKVGESIHISQLKEIPGVRFMADPEALVISCAVPKVVEEKEEEAPAETIVIGEAERAAKEAAAKEEAAAGGKPAKAAKE